MRKRCTIGAMYTRRFPPAPLDPREAPEGVESILLEQVLMRPLLEERQPNPVLHKVVLIRRRSRLHRY